MDQSSARKFIHRKLLYSFLEVIEHQNTPQK